jgi:DNA-binding CsgD family transcriptional regulator
MLRELIRRISTRLDDAPKQPGPGHGRRVLFEAQVDRIQCLVIELPVHDPCAAHVVLSPREQEIARMVSKGYANKTIAAVLEISTWTVGTYIRRIFAKLGVGSRAAMVTRLQECETYPGIRKLTLES